MYFKCDKLFNIEQPSFCSEYSFLKPVMFVFTLTLLTACGGGSPASNVDTNDDGSISNNKNPIGPVTISLIQMNDLHANLIAHKDAFRIQDSNKINLEMTGGLGRIAAKVKLIRASNEGNSILMNIGDTFHGGAEALFSNGNNIVEAVNQLNIDIGVPGNWDFAYGPIITNARFGNLRHDDVARPNYEMLAANATYRIPPSLSAQPIAARLIQYVFNYTAGEPFLPATKIINRSGVKIGFIGLTSDIVEFMHPLMAFNLDFVKEKANYLTLIEANASELRAQGANIIVLMSELGIHKDWALAKSLSNNSVDVIFSAHTHEITNIPLQTDSGILVVEAGNDSFLGQMDITVENGEITKMDWQLHLLDINVTEDPDMQRLVEQIREPYLLDNPNMTPPVVSLNISQLSSLMPTQVLPMLRMGLDQIVATTRQPLDRRHSLESNFSNWFSDRLRNENQTDLAMTSGFRFDSVVIPSIDAFDGNAVDYLWQSETPEILNGEIHVADAYRYFPAPFNIAKGNVTIGQLKEIIESNLEYVYSTDAFSQKGGWTDGFSGIEITLDLNAEFGQRLKQLRLSSDGSVPQNERIVSITGCARPFDLQAQTTLCGYTGFTNVENLINPTTGEAFIAADYFLQSVMNNNIEAERDIPRQSINELSKQLQWPASEFYQPLEGAQ